MTKFEKIHRMILDLPLIESLDISYKNIFDILIGRKVNDFTLKQSICNECINTNIFISRKASRCDECEIRKEKLALASEIDELKEFMEQEYHEI